MLVGVDPVDYVDTFIAVADNSNATMGTVPPSRPENPSVAARTFQMISEHPYRGCLVRRGFSCDPRW